MDLADAHVAALKYMINNPPGYHVFNVGAGHGVSVFELIRAFERV